MFKIFLNTLLKAVDSQHDVIPSRYTPWVRPPIDLDEDRRKALYAKFVATNKRRKRRPVVVGIPSSQRPFIDLHLYHYTIRGKGL